MEWFPVDLTQAQEVGRVVGDTLWLKGDGPKIPTEKERVYEELERVQNKCYRLRQEVKRLRAATASSENARLRREAQTYRQALSAIIFHFEQGDLTLASARGLALRALSDDPMWTKSQRQRRRRQIALEQTDGPDGHARRAASGDEPDQGAANAPRPLSTTRAAGQVASRAEAPHSPRTDNERGAS